MDAASLRVERRRDDGEAKVTGSWRYVDDLRADAIGQDLVHGFVVVSQIATGRVLSVDDTDCRAMPGVIDVITHQTAPRLKRPNSISMGEIAELLPLQDDRVLYRGQAIAVVIADTRRAAKQGAAALHVSYEENPNRPAVHLDDDPSRLAAVKRAGIAPGKIIKGKAEDDYAAAETQIDITTHHAPQHHNAIEPGAAIARWDDDGGVTVWAAVQWYHHETLAIGKAFGLGLRDGFAGFLARAALGADIQSRVRLINQPAGGAFGRNINMVHVLIACIVAKVTGRTAKVELDRQQTYSLYSYRSEVRHRVRLGADQQGQLICQLHDPDIAVGAAGAYVEPVANWPLHVYRHKSHALVNRVAKLDLNGSGWMRGPGGSAGIFGLETGMDMLARELSIDPVELRLANVGEHDGQGGKPWSSNEIKACFKAASEAFDWLNRPKGGAARADGRLTGCGMATAFEPHFRFPATARVTLKSNGQCVVSCAVSEIGQGLHHGLRSLAAQSMGVARENVTLQTAAPDAAYAAGSVAATGLHSNGGSIHVAIRKIKSDLFKKLISEPSSLFHGADADTLSIDSGLVIGSGNLRISVSEAMAQIGATEITAKATTGRNFDVGKKAKGSFGAVFAEISIDPITREIAVERLVGAFDCGRIIDPRIAHGQIVGGMIWGLGQALMEETRLDPIRGAWDNAEIGEALVPTAADIPQIEAIFVPSGEANTASPASCKSVSELGIYGTPAAIANAVFDATGHRLTSLPLKIEHRIIENADISEGSS